MKDSAGQERVFSELAREWSERAKSPITVESVLARWDRFTRNVEAGYPLGLDDYTNDLSSRDMIAELERRLGRLRPAIAQGVAESDERFLAATSPQSRPMRNLDIKPELWWWFRRPVLAGPVLVEDLAREEGTP